MRRFPPRCTSSSRLRTLCIVTAALCLTGVLRAEEPATTTKDPQAPKVKSPKKKDPAAEQFAALRKLYRSNPAKAVEGFGKFLTQFPRSEWTDDARYWLAMSLERSRAKRRDVIAAYKAVVDKHPGSSYRNDALFAIAETWRRHARRPEDYNQAVRAYLDFIKLVPKSERVSEATLKIGEIYQYLGQHEKASGYFARVVKEHPKSPYVVRAHMKLAVSALRLKKPDEALALYAKLLEQDRPHKERINVQLGMVDCYLAQTDGLTKAIETCKTIRSEATRRKSLEDFTEYRTREKMASYYLRRKKYAEAEAEYRAYVTRFGNSVGVWQAKFNIGTIRRAAGKPAEARKMFQEIIRKHKDKTKKAPWYLIQAMYYEAYTYEMEKNHDEALRHYRKLIARYPTHYQARRARDKISQIEKRIAEEKKKAAQKKPGDKKPPARPEKK